MQKKLTSILALTALAFGVVCAVQWKQLRAEKERARALEKARHIESEARNEQSVRVKELERAKVQLDHDVQQLARANANARKAGGSAAAGQPVREAESHNDSGNDGSASTDESKGGLFGKGMGEMLGKMMKDPAMREMVRSQQKAAANMMYSGLFKELNLTAEEKDKVTGILADAQMKAIESSQALFGQPTEGAGEDTANAIAESKKQMDADLKVLLGEERFAHYEEYQKNVGERMQVDQLKNHLQAQNLPLEDQQMTQLIQVMQEEKAASPPVMPTDGPQSSKDFKNMLTAENFDKQMQWMEDYNRRVLDRAGQFLTPEQVKQYREFQEQQSSMQKMGLKMAREMFGSGKGGAVPPEAPRP